jgi:hypothetical protein
VKAVRMLALGLMFVGVLACTSSAVAQIAWRSGEADITAAGPGELQAELTNLAARAQSRHVVIQATGPLTEEQKLQLSSDGLELLAYVSGHGWFASLDGGADVAALTNSGLVAGASEVLIDWKADPMILAGTIPPYVVASEGAVAGDPIVGIYLVFHADESIADTGLDLVDRYNGEVRDTVDVINTLVVELPYSQVLSLAAEDAVQWVEWPLPPMDVNNDSNRAITQAGSAQAPPYNLDGTGITVLVYDGGTANSAHPDFGGRLTVHDGSGTANHATHVSGTVGGDGTNSGGQYRGMAPNVQIVSFGFEYDGSGIFLYSNPGDIQNDYSNAINFRGADIANNSIGTNTARNGFPCDITGDYGVTSALIDSIVTGSLGTRFRICWSNGNERGTTRCGTTYSTTAPPACAKNHITVGALNSNNDSMTDFSSWGPTDDGRLKPDISGPGCQSSGDFGVTSTVGSSGYDSYCGTSMSGPTVTGCSALLLQDFRANYPGFPDPWGSTLKAIWAHTAVDLGNTGPDYQFGYGSIRVIPAINVIRNGSFTEDSVGQSQSYSRQVEVGPGTPEFKVTLAWDDRPGTPNVNPNLVNDLDLIVTDPSGGRHYPWTLNPSSPSTPAVRTQADHVNNIEQVLVSNPQVGTWTVEVFGYNVPFGPQTFSLAGDGAQGVGLSFSFPGGLPELMAPETAYPIDVEVRTIGQSLVPGSPTMFYRYAPGAYTSVALQHIGGDLYRGTLPAALCDDAPEFYFSAEGTESGVQFSPAGAPSTVYSANVGEVVTFFTDNFQTNKGWTVENGGGLSDGAWERAVPAGGGDRGDPPSDADGSGFCYVTDNADDNSDVDGGYTRLISPTIDLSGGDADVTFQLWYTNNNGDDPNNDIFVISISNNNGGSWTTVETVGPNSPPAAWIEHSFRVSDFITPTSQMKLRFEASDLNSGSIVEAGLDAVQIDTFECESEEPTPEACCYEDGTCADQLPVECLSASGTPQGADTSCAMIECPQPDDREIVIGMQSSVEPDDLCPGESFSVDVYLSSENGDIDDVRLLQFDTSLTSGATVDGFTWDMEALTDMSLYLLDDEPEVVRAVYATDVGLPGFIVNLNSTPQKVAVVDLTFGGGSGEVNLLGPGGPPGDFSVRFQADFTELNEYTATNGKVQGGVLLLSEGPCEEIMIIGSTPPDGAIDARRPHAPDDPGMREGWALIDVEFDGDVAGLVPGDFTLTEEGGDGTPPNILSVSPSSPTSVIVAFDDIIEPLAWTTLTHVASGTSVRVGYLPGDANQDAFSSSFDTLALIDHLNNIVLLPEPYATDIDRSGVSDSFDILELINLLNGAEMYDVYNEAELP